MLQKLLLAATAAALVVLVSPSEVNAYGGPTSGTPTSARTGSITPARR
jgi:hypothetical protein